MNHKVNNVQQLYEDAKSMYNTVVNGENSSSASSIMNNLYSGIETLKNCWEGKDAGVQIQNLIVVYNALVSVRNSLGVLAETTTKIASSYRDIQNSNGAGLEQLIPVVNEQRTVLSAYSDNRDTINITTEANTGNSKVVAANSEIDNFISGVRRYFDAIMNNWTVGSGRDEFQEEFNSFVNNATRYKELLNEATTSISTAIKNYGM